MFLPYNLSRNLNVGTHGQGGQHQARIPLVKKAYPSSD